VVRSTPGSCSTTICISSFAIPKQLNGADVARKIAECVEPDTPIFIHSMNPQRRGDILVTLEEAGFEVTQIPMSELDARKLAVWLEQVDRVHAERAVDEVIR
jgi:hypothetical protein